MRPLDYALVAVTCASTAIALTARDSLRKLRRDLEHNFQQLLGVFRAVGVPVTLCETYKEAVKQEKEDK
jgi:hypothetical protein